MRYRPAIQEGDRAEILLVQAHAMKRAPSLIESLKSSPSLLQLLLRSSKHNRSRAEKAVSVQKIPSTKTSQ